MSVDVYLDVAQAGDGPNDIRLYPDGPHSIGPIVYEVGGSMVGGNDLTGSRSVEARSAGLFVGGNDLTGGRTASMRVSGGLVDGQAFASSSTLQWRRGGEVAEGSRLAGSSTSTRPDFHQRHTYLTVEPSRHRLQVASGVSRGRASSTGRVRIAAGVTITSITLDRSGESRVRR